MSRLAKLGRFGDTELVHVNKEEAALLRARGGSGTINPKTGLHEFFVSGDRDFGGWGEPANSSGSYDGNTSNDPSGGGSDKKETGWRHSDPWNNPAPGQKPSQSVEAHMSNISDWQSARAAQRGAALSGSLKARKSSAFDPSYTGVSVEEDGSGAHPRHERQWGAATSPKGPAIDRLSGNMDARFAHMNPADQVYNGGAQANPAAAAYEERRRDYKNIGNTSLDNFGNFIGSAFGFNEIAPTFSPGNLSTRANWGFNPFSGIPGAAIGLGLTMANPALGVGYELFRGSIGKTPAGSALSAAARIGSMVNPFSRFTQALAGGSVLNGLADEFDLGVDDLLGTRTEGWSGVNVGPDVMSPDLEKAKESLSRSLNEANRAKRGSRVGSNRKGQNDNDRASTRSETTSLKSPEQILYPNVEDSENEVSSPYVSFGKSKVRRPLNLSALNAKRANFGRVR